MAKNFGRKGLGIKKPRYLKVAITVLFYLIWTAIAVIGPQWLIGIIMVSILGIKLDSSLVLMVYYIFSYAITLMLLIWLPMHIAMNQRSDRSRRSAQPSTRAKQKNIAEERSLIGIATWPIWTDIGLAPVGFIVYLLLAAGIVACFNHFAWFDPREAQELGFRVYAMGAERMFAFLTLVVIAPIAEEIVFRGWLYGKLKNRLSGTYSSVTSIIISSLLVSLLFGAVHLQWNVAVNVFAMSLVACMLREITGTIYSGIFLHMIKNGLAFYLLFFVGLG